MIREIRKITYASILLVLLLMSVACVSSGTTTPNHAGNISVQKEKQTSPWGSSWIDVYVQEKYGPKDNPQYRPLGNVSLTLWGCNRFTGLPTPLFHFLKWRHDGEFYPPWFEGTTTDQGYFVIPSVYMGCYRLFAFKDGYVDLHYKWGVVIAMDGTPGSATCTLTAKGSAWDPSIT
jgi:hypothetical protein